MPEGLLLFAWLMFLPGFVHMQTMPMYRARSAIGWMFAALPLYQARCTVPAGIHLQHQGWMCPRMMSSFAAAQIRI